MMQRDRLIGIVVKNPPAVFWAKGTGHDGKPWQINAGSAGAALPPENSRHQDVRVENDPHLGGRINPLTPP